MRADISNIPGLLLPKGKAQAKQRSGRIVAQEKEQAVLMAIRHFGHLRTLEIAAAVWPDAAYGQQMACRVIKRLVAAGLILARKNTLASHSYVLTSRGARRLELMGLPCRHGRDIVGVSGATFLHRTLATRYLIEQQRLGANVYGEYAIAHGWAPLKKDVAAKRFGKLPDGLVFHENLQPNKPNAVDWVEVEQSAKSLDELKAVLRVALKLDDQIRSGDRLSRLVIVFDKSENHAQRIAKAASEIWFDRNLVNISDIESRILLVFADVDFPLICKGFKTISLREYRKNLA